MTYFAYKGKEYTSLELLPSTCPSCGGPISGSQVKWTGPQSADCPSCGVNLPMRTDAGCA